MCMYEALNYIVHSHSINEMSSKYLQAKQNKNTANDIVNMDTIYQNLILDKS